MADRRLHWNVCCAVVVDMDCLLEIGETACASFEPRTSVAAATEILNTVLQRLQYLGPGQGRCRYIRAKGSDGSIRPGHGFRT